MFVYLSVSYNINEDNTQHNIFDIATGFLQLWQQQSDKSRNRAKYLRQLSDN